MSSVDLHGFNLSTYLCNSGSDQVCKPQWGSQWQYAACAADSARLITLWLTALVFVIPGAHVDMLLQQVCQSLGVQCCIVCKRGAAIIIGILSQLPFQAFMYVSIAHSTPTIEVVPPPLPHATSTLSTHHHPDQSHSRHTKHPQTNTPTSSPHGHMETPAPPCAHVSVPHGLGSMRVSSSPMRASLK